MENSGKKCRICLQHSKIGVLSLSEELSVCKKACRDIYLHVSGFSPTSHGPQHLCRVCTNELYAAWKIIEKIKNSEQTFNNIVEIIKIEECESVKAFEIKPHLTYENHVLKENTEELNNVLLGTINGVSEKTDVQSSFIRKRMQCSNCSYTSTNRRNYHRHYTRMHKSNRFKCSECLKMYRTREDMDTHKRDTHLADVVKTDKNHRKVQCPYCLQSFNKYVLLYDHCNEMHPEVQFSCPDCNETFALESKLKKHRKTVHGYKPINPNTSICCHCGKIMTVIALDAHIKNVHSKQNIEYTCDKCNIKVQTKSGLINHMHQKHLGTHFACRYCGEAFPNYGMRRTHEVRYHTFALKFNCNVCEKKFLTGAELRKHIVKHTGEKKYRCDICGLQLATQGNWKLHLARHSDLRPFVCEICAASFKTKSALRVHDRVHTERNYECPVCDNKYFSNQQLRQHVVKIHPDYPLPPKGTIMHKKALMKISETNTKYNLDTVTYSMLSKQASR